MKERRVRKAMSWSFITLAVLFVLASCAAPSFVNIPDSGLPDASNSTNPEEPQTAPLVNDQNTMTGVVTVWNDGTNFYVEFSTINGWLMNSASVAITKSSQMLLNSYSDGGSLNPQQFPYSATFVPRASSHTFAIPLGSLQPGDVVNISAHANVYHPSSGSSRPCWARGTNGEWTEYFAYTVRAYSEDPQDPNGSQNPEDPQEPNDPQDPEDPQEPVNPQYREVGSAWSQGISNGNGIAMYFNYAKNASFSLQLQIGRDRVNVGTVEISTGGNEVTVTVTTHEPYYMLQLHVYYGVNVPGTAPGLYPLKYEYAYFNTYTFTFDVTSLPDSFYMAVHAKMYEKF